MSELLGRECLLQVNMGTAGAPNFQPLTKIKDVDIGLTAGSADVTTRGDEGWTNRVAGLKEWSVSGEAKYDPDDTVLAKVNSALWSGDKIQVRLLDEQDGAGVEGYVLVTDFSRSEPLDGAVMVSITMEGCGKPTRV